MKKTSMALNILTLFAQYSFRKSSMSEIAKAAGISRQSLYNQFGSKEEILDWAVISYFTDIADAAIAILTDEKGDAVQLLADAYQKWIGESVPLLRGTPHGAEILDYVIESVTASSRDFEQEFAIALIQFLKKTGLAQHEQDAEDLAYLLHLASKGLLLKCENSDQFSAGMSRVIRVLTS